MVLCLFLYNWIYSFSWNYPWKENIQKFLRTLNLRIKRVPCPSYISSTISNLLWEPIEAIKPNLNPYISLCILVRTVYIWHWRSILFSPVCISCFYVSNISHLALEQPASYETLSHTQCLTNVTHFRFFLSSRFLSNLSYF